MRRTNAKLFARLEPQQWADPSVVIATAAEIVAETLLHAHEDAGIVDAFEKLAQVVREERPRGSRLRQVAALADALDAAPITPVADETVEQARVAVVEAWVASDVGHEAMRAAVARFAERVLLGALEPAFAEHLVTLDVQSRHRAALRDAVLRATGAIAVEGDEEPRAFLVRALAQLTDALRGHA